MEFQTSSGLSAVVARILWVRGIRSVGALQDLRRVDQPLSSPGDLPDLDRAVDLLAAARLGQKRVRVYGDYDADGVTATAVMYQGLRWAGFENVDYYIPNRFDEGYGLHPEGVEQAVADGVDLLVTVDCGSSSPDAARLAKKHGLTLIVTDHHGLPPDIPDVPALVNPERMNRPNRFSGAGVALQVVRALLHGDLPGWAYGIAAVGTVADVVPLTGDNRRIVQRGLPALENGACPGITALLGDRLKPGQQLSADDLAFFVGPHLNASGRMGDAAPAVSLLLSGSLEEAKPWAEDLRTRNHLRREIERDLVEQALQQIPMDKKGNVPGFVVVAGDNWHHGVVGIVASRLKDRLKRPVAVIGWDGTSGKGSARSVPGLDLFGHLGKSRDAFLKLGGHRGACGFSLLRQDAQELSRKFSRDLPPEILAQQFVGGEVDAIVEAAALTPEVADQILGLEPYGHGFERPRLAVNGSIGEMRRMGSEKTHLSLTLAGSPFRAVAFSQAAVSESMEKDGFVEFVGELVLNQFQGRKTPQWHVEQFVGVSASRKQWRGSTRFSPAPDDLPGRVLYVVNSTREQKRWALKTHGRAWYHYWPYASWAGSEQASSLADGSPVVINQWAQWPHLANWADHIVWLTAPVSRDVLMAASAILKESSGIMWIDPELDPAGVLAKARRLTPTRETLARLWTAWEASQAPLVIGARVFRELGFRRGEKPAARRQLADSPSFERARHRLMAAERDWRRPAAEWDSTY